MNVGMGGQMQPQMQQRQSSVVVKDNWVSKEDFDFPRLAKLSTSQVSASVLFEKLCLLRLRALLLIFYQL